MKEINAKEVKKNKKVGRFNLSLPLENTVI